MEMPCQICMKQVCRLDLPVESRARSRHPQVLQSPVVNFTQVKLELKYQTSGKCKVTAQKND